MSIGRYAYFDLALASAALPGLVARRMLLPFVSCQDWHGRLSAHYGLVLEGVFHHLGYLLSLDFQPFLICKFTRGICSDLEGPFLFGCLGRFSEESPEWSANFLNRFRASWRLCSVHSMWVSPLLPPGFQVSYRFSGGASFWGITIVPKFSLILGVFRSSRKDCSAIASDVPGRLVPTFCRYRLDKKKVWMGRFPSIWKAYECIRLSSFSVSRRG